MSSKARLVEEGFLGRKVRMEKGVKANGSQKVGRKAERQTKGLKHGSLHTPRLTIQEAPSTSRLRTPSDVCILRKALQVAEVPRGLQQLVHPDRAPQVKDRQDSQGPMGESSGMCQQGCRSLVPSGPCWAASTMEKVPEARAVSAQRGCQDICTRGSPAEWGRWGHQGCLPKGT